MEGIPMLILSVGGIILMLFFVTYSSQRHNLNSIKDKTVGNGQHGTARWATQQEIKRIYHHVPFTPEQWRQEAREGRQPTANGKALPQGIVLGSKGMKTTTALVDSDDVHVMMIGASGVGKTAYFLYPNLEYACASGMSFLALDTKGDLARNYGAIARDIYGYRISVVDLREPTRSDGNNLLTLINRYMDKHREDPKDIGAKAKAEKYAKILAKTIINPEGDGTDRGQNAYFYDAAEGLLASVVLLLAEFLPPEETGGYEMRHIASVFKLVQDLLMQSSSRRGGNQFQELMSLLPADHKAKWLAGSALTASDQGMNSIMSTVLSKLNAFLDTELEQVICFDGSIDAELFVKEKCAIFERFNADVDRTTQHIAKTSESIRSMIQIEKPVIPSMMNGLPAMLPKSQMNAALTTASKYQDLIQTTRRLQEAKDELDERWDEVGDRISELWSDSSCFLIKPREWIAEQYGEKIADIWAGIEVEDPYALCFAFLYLVDQGSDYPWVYYPGVTLFSMTMDTLPWCRTAYKGGPEGVWDHFDPDTMELVPGPLQAELPKRIKIPELENWNRMQYLDQYEDELGYQEKVSLAQVMYELTGCIMPRNQQRYFPALSDLDAYGITGKKALHPLIYCMNLLGEGKYRSRKLPQMEWTLEESHDEEQKNGHTESVEELKARIAALQSENRRLRQTVYEADRELRETKKTAEVQEQKAELDRQELADLRELVFHLQEDVYDAEAESTGISFPYHNFQRIVVFGGHDSWAREIKPRLPDVRFVDKDMVPNAELIRRADIVWVQANAISHAYYYKILDETRKHSIPVRYFSYASALKCAEQLAEQDLKEAQK